MCLRGWLTLDDLAEYARGEGSARWTSAECSDLLTEVYQSTWSLPSQFHCWGGAMNSIRVPDNWRFKQPMSIIVRSNSSDGDQAYDKRHRALTLNDVDWLKIYSWTAMILIIWFAKLTVSYSAIKNLDDKSIRADLYGLKLPAIMGYQPLTSLNFYTFWQTSTSSEFLVKILELST